MGQMFFFFFALGYATTRGIMQGHGIIDAVGPREVFFSEVFRMWVFARLDLLRGERLGAREYPGPMSVV